MSRPRRMRRPALAMRASITAGRPIRIGRASPSSTTTLRRAQHALVFAFGIGHAFGAVGQRLAALNTGRISMPVGVDKARQLPTVGVHVLDGARGHARRFGRGLATAGAMRRIRRESKGLGMR